MSLQSVRQFFAEHAPDIEIIELNQSTATVALAAAARSVEPGPQNCQKQQSLKIKDKIVLIVARGDARLDNKKLKETFGAKARMLSSDGSGYLDRSSGRRRLPVWSGKSAGSLLRRLSPDIIRKYYHPQRGAIHSAVRVEPERMAQLTDATWRNRCVFIAALRYLFNSACRTIER